MFALLSSLSRSSPIAWSQKSAEPTRSGFNSRTLKVQSICEVVLKVAAWLRLRWHCVKLTLLRSVSAWQVFQTNGSIDDFEFAEETSTTATITRKKCSTPPKTACPTPFWLSRDIRFTMDVTPSQKVWTVLRPLHIALTTCTRLPTNRQTCSQRSQWRRAIALALERRG